MSKKKTLILGATTNPNRYAYLAFKRLKSYGHDVVLLGNSKGEIDGEQIETIPPQLEDVDTVTLYLRPELQKQYYDYIFSLNPRRIIFNPSTENYELVQLAKTHGIETILGCTLVMLSVGDY